MGSSHRDDHHSGLTMASSFLASPRATLDVLARHELYTKKSLGQHFLVDDHVIARILELAAVSERDTVLEVGPGIGTLTVALCPKAGAVIAVEHDVRLVPVLAETTDGCPRFSLVQADATSVTAEEIGAAFGPPTALVSNLPYGVAATVVLRYFELLPTLEQATVMVQSEVADRMTASPGTKAYGAYTVKLSLFARPAGRFSVARGCFLPPPRVDSAVVRLERSVRPESPELITRAARLADAAFAQRRKTIRNSMRATMGIEVAHLDAALEAAGIAGSVRAEMLEPEAFVRLAQAFAAEEAL